MAHKTMVDATAYEITGGKVLDNGTAYEIDHGRVMDAGTVYDIAFAADLISFTVLDVFAPVGGDTFQAEEGMTWAKFCSSNYNSDGSFTIMDGVVKFNNYFLYNDRSFNNKVASSAVIISGYKYYY